MNNRQGDLKPSVLGFGAKTFFGVMALAVMGYALFLTAFANESNQIWEALRPWLIFWRLGLLLALIGGWRYWVKSYASFSSLDPESLQALLAARRQVAITLLLVELLIIQPWPSLL